MQIEIGFNSAPDRHWRSYYCAATAFHVRPSPGHSLCVASPPDGRFLLPREAAMHTYQELAQDIPKEYEALKESAHRFAAEILRPASIELDRMADPRDVIALDSPLRRVFKKGYELSATTSRACRALSRAVMIYNQPSATPSLEHAIGRLGRIREALRREDHRVLRDGRFTRTPPQRHRTYRLDG